MSNHSVSRFFDALISDYTQSIERCFPRYREMLWALLHYLPQDTARYSTILELGCGTGNLSVLLAEAFPDASIFAVDVSSESLAECRTRLADRVQFSQQDMRRLEYEPESFDLIISSIAIHHLTSAEKRRLFENCRGWLRRDGLLSFADQFKGATDDLYTRHMETWKQQSFAAGGTEQEFEMWMRHQRDHDHHDTLGNQLDWLSQAGYQTTDCTWRYLLWSVVQARC